MPRSATSDSIDQIVRAAAQGVVARATVSISRAVTSLVANDLERKLRARLVGRVHKSHLGRARSRRAGRPRLEITKWTADRRARRVPKFVIEATGLDTKKKIVAKYGQDARFEKGKALPKAK